MKINIGARVLVVSAALLLPMYSAAWTVSDKVVALPHEPHEPHGTRHTAVRTIELRPQEPDPEMPLMIENESTVEKMPDQAVATQKNTTFFQKNAALLDSDEQALMDYHRAVKHIHNGQLIQAKQILLNIIDRLPGHHASRIELVSLYIKENRLEESEDLLLTGLNLDDNNSDFLKLLAMVYDKQDEPERALSLLVKVKDSRRQDKSHIAFLGHLYQQTGRYTLARQQYYHLLQMEPKNGLWLLGVSVALDAEGQKEAALEGYRRLTADGSINQGVLQYVQSRIDVLEG